MYFYGKSHNHLTFGELVTIIGKLPKESPLYASSNSYYPVLSIHSYRGYYEDMEFDTGSTPVTVGEFLEMLLSNAGTTIEGYRGGEYIVDDRSYMWVGYEGGTARQALNGVCINADDSYTLVTSHVED